MPGASIEVSDQEMSGVSANGYTFMPAYMNNPELATGYDAFLLDNHGAGYKKTAADAVNITAFRPYFVAPQPANGAPRHAQYIVFNNISSSLGDDDASNDKIGEGVDIYGGKRSVVVTSNLRKTADVRIFNVGGLCIANFNIEPGQTIETPVYRDGVYVVHAAGGRYRTKLGVK